MNPATILIIDDEPQLRQMLARLLASESYAVTQAENARAGLKAFTRQDFQLVLCDVKLPDGNGVDLTEIIRAQHPDTEVIVFTAFGNIPDGVRAIKNGAFDYLVKGDDNDKILPRVAKAIEKARLQQRVRELERQLAVKTYTFDTVTGHSPAIRQTIELAQKVAPTDTTVLLTGETGTGKEVFAQAIHRASRRRDRNFVAINCSAFSRELLESELFGHVAGAFTGASKDKKGLFAEAGGGTLFLDEISEMPADLQAKLLRVLENGDYLRVGDTKPQTADVRIIAATNRDLKQESETGHFRPDLFYRLSVFGIHLPPLRERRQDIGLLANHFAGYFSEKMNKRIAGITPEFTAALLAHDWPGNVRELRNIIERAVILENSNCLSMSSLPLELQHPAATSADGRPPAPTFDLAAAEKLHILKVMRHTGGNKSEAARLLGIAPATLYRKLGEWGM
ncbi:MAG: sigma-54-dependent Fis family transcriptional regulator [Lewinellaceae bacterium]|nr:sigma-54-dependent Fis family transcriptional regulator [Lewinellaceae bacterium]